MGAQLTVGIIGVGTVIGAVLLFLLGFSSGRGEIGFFVRALFAANFLVMASVALIGLVSANMRVHRALAFMSVVSILALLYFAISFCFGALVGNHVIDALGGVLRAIMPFSILLGLCFVFSSYLNDVEYLRKFVLIFLLVGVFQSIGKVVLILLGNYYGAGLNQYMIGTYLFSFLLISILYHDSIPRKMAIAAVVIFLLFLSVMSLKRTVWVQLVFMLFATAMVMPFRFKVWSTLIALICIAYVLFNHEHIAFIDRVVMRFEYTFSGADGGLDASSSRRIIELEGAWQKYMNSYPILSAWFGVGPGTGFDLSYLGEENRNTNEYGEAYHIHLFWGIVAFRFGITGLVLYLLPFVAGLYFSYKAATHMLGVTLKSKSSESFWICVAAFGGGLDLVVKFIGTFGSNSFYGDITYGISVFVVAWAFYLMRKNYAGRDY